MNSTQLLILGNGFDLHCGLQSSYKDFFRLNILDTIGERFSLQQMKYGVSGFWEGLLLEYYKIYGNVDYSWCDIESIIKDTLWLICFGKDKESIRTNSGLWKTAYGSAGWRRNPPEALSSIDDPIERYLFMYCFNFYYSFLRASYSDEDLLHMLLSNILHELHNFEKRFCKYLKSCIFDKQNNVNVNYVVGAVNLLARITNFSVADFEDVDDIIDKKEQTVWKYVSDNQRISDVKRVNVLADDFDNLKNTHILSFNYTHLFDILGVESPCIYSNVHGKLCSENCAENCNGSNIIFGIDDTLIQSQEVNSQLRVFSKTYRKMVDTSAHASILPSNSNEPIEIKFYGHSLSEADYSYFQSIFDFYDLYSNNNVSLIFYHSKGFEQNNSVYKLIKAYGKTLDNKDQGKNLMHKLLLENRLKIVKLPDNE